MIVTPLFLSFKPDMMLFLNSKIQNHKRLCVLPLGKLRFYLKPYNSLFSYQKSSMYIPFRKLRPLLKYFTKNRLSMQSSVECLIRIGQKIIISVVTTWTGTCKVDAPLKEVKSVCKCFHWGDVCLAFLEGVSTVSPLSPHPAKAVTFHFQTLESLHDGRLCGFISFFSFLS